MNNRKVRFDRVVKMLTGEIPGGFQATKPLIAEIASDPLVSKTEKDFAESLIEQYKDDVRMAGRRTTSSAERARMFWASGKEAR